MLRPATESDRAALYDICLRTADRGEDATALVTDPDLYGHIWAGPYLTLEPRYATVAVDDEVVGYVLGAFDTTSYEDRRNTEWFPRLQERYPLPLPATWTRPQDEDLVRQIHGNGRTNTLLVSRYPSHLHIDLLPRAQGHGMGRHLITHLLDQLRADGSRGVHLIASAENAGALAFYRRLGFTEYEPIYPGAVVFVQDLS